MRLLPRLLTGTALALIGTQTLALTAEEVWANQTGYLNSNGVNVSQTQTRDGAVLTISDISYDISLPFGAGSISVKTAPQIMTENADGTVSISFAADNTIAVAATVRPDDITEFYAAANIDLTLTGYSAVASGTANDVTYVTHADLIEMTLTDLTLSGAPEAELVEVQAYLSVADHDTRSQITTGAVTTLDSTSTSGQTITDYSFAFGQDFLSKTVSQQSGTVFSGKLTLPGGPINLMNISQALRDGLALEFTANTTAGQSQAVTMSFGEMLSNQISTFAAAASTLRFDASGLGISGSAADIAVDVPVMAGVPFPMNAALGAVDYDFAFPVNASDQPAPVRYAFSMTDVTMHDDIWAMFDAGAALPRDPISIRADIGGTVVIRNDLLDIEGMSQIIDAGGMPFDPRSVSINALSASGLGATATGSGEFTLDMSDLITFDGFPRPTGQATATITGVNGLLDNLISAGLLTTEDAMSGRLMMGMFARVAGDDQLTSTFQINDQGHVIANGQRIQ